ncbi:hypothetical protein SLS53_007384 [Cytospora paraplurivora]|uniref:Micro-fibrillar-associated protein 1 C-terminal domain-containing protein n=1 Tax=Cytospora paraplurivora TaxID=2898453 RepID=A0AAN9U855_9PEZI
MPPKRMTANPIKPSRHRAGKPTRASDSSSSESEASDAEAETKPQAPRKRTIAPPPKVPSAGRIISTNTVKPDDNVKKLAAARQRAEIERKAREEGFVTEDEDDEEGGGGVGAGSEESGSDEESGSEESSSEEDESSSEEGEAAPRRLMIRPKFISKAARAQTQEDPLEREQALEAQRRADADALVEAQIQKDIAARAAGKKHWDDSDSEGDGVDDEDGVDPEAEYAAWKLRELRRLKRSREAVEAREAEIAEKERRQALTEEERAAEDEALVARQKEEKESRGKMGFMQKYYHKGAFYQDDLKTEGLDKRDLMGARFADEVKNRELLPQALQMRDMTKLGKKGASKYKDLKSEDTGSWGRFDDPRRQRDQQWDRYRDGDRDGPGGGGGGDFGGQGANAMPLGRRRSRSPRRDRDDHRERKREYSRERGRHDDDKRRRVDSR